MVKNLAIYERSRGVELRATEKQPQLAVRVGLESGTSGFQVKCPNHLPRCLKCITLSTSVLTVLFAKQYS